MKSTNCKDKLLFNDMSLSEKTLEYWQISSCRNNRPSKEYIISHAIKDIDSLLNTTGRHRKIFKHLIELQDDIVRNGVKKNHKKCADKSAKILVLK